MPLDRDAAERAVTNRVAAPLGYDTVRAADAIIQVANANMADAVRLISIRRGYDPRDFCLVAFGGAGSVHAAHLARELDIPAVVIPPYPGITSALRLPPPRRATRSLPHLPDDGGPRQQRRVEAEFAGWKVKRGIASPSRGSKGTACNSGGSWICAMSVSGAR